MKIAVQGLFWILRHEKEQQRGCAKLQKRRSCSGSNSQGKRYTFEKMIKLARENGVIVYKDSDLAEVLFHIREGKEIPFELYSAVSEVIAYCWKVNGTIE